MSSPNDSTRPLPTSFRLYRRAASTLALALLATTVWLSPSPAAAAEESRRFTRSFPADQAVRLANLAGRVTVEAGSGDSVEVVATVYAEASSATETRRLLDAMAWKGSDHVLKERGWALAYPVDDYDSFHYPPVGGGGEPGWLARLFGGWGETRLSYDGERVSIQGHRSRSAPTLYVDLEIRVPAGTELVISNGVGPISGDELAGDFNLDTASGDVHVDGFTGELLVDTGSGDVILGRVVGRLHVDTGSGDVEVESLVGHGLVDTGSGHIEIRRADADTLNLDTGSGDIEVRGGRLGKVVADTGSGDVRFEDVEVVDFVADTGSGDVELYGSLASAERVEADTGSGDVVIHGGPDAGFVLTTSLGSGDLTVRYDDAELERRGREVVGARRGDGRTRIHVDTGSGDCVLAPGR